MGQYRLNLNAIEQSLRGVQQEFPKINEIPRSRRDSMTDEVIANMMAGYTLVDQALADDHEGLTFRHASYLLEFNHTVLCGLNPRDREDSRKHIEATEQRFYGQEDYNIEDILQWYHRHAAESPWKRAAGVYVRILSQPQLFFEGNHRTAALIMSYILVGDGRPPFVLSVDNARAYFDPSSLVKETTKSAVTLLMKLPRLKKRFARFLEEQAHAHYILSVASNGR
jgi:hypothetical protein